MRDFSRSITIAAPAEIVWGVLRDGERWSEWTPTVRSIRPLDAGPLRVGQRFLIRQPKLPPAMWRVTEIQEGRGFVWISRAPGVTVRAHHWVEAEGSGSRVTLSLRFDGILGGVAGRITARLNTSYLDIEAESLRRRCEGGVNSSHQAEK